MIEPKILITLCASHITEVNRLNHFKNMLKSFKNQTVKSNLYISMSFDSSLNDKIDEIIAHNVNYNIKIFKQDHAMSQFQHYKFLTEQFDNIFSNFVWCLFVDDDDYLNSKRNAEYTSILNRVNDRNEICIQNSSLMVSSWEKFDKTSKELNSQLNTGKDSTYVLALSNEYCTYCVKLNALKKFCNFLERMNKLDTKQCDVVFASMLVKKCKTFSILYKSEWLYAYNQSRSHSRTCQTIGIDYYVNNYSDIFFDEFSKEFNFNWTPSNPKGFSYIYTLELHKTAIEKRDKVTVEKSKSKNLLFKCLFSLPIILVGAKLFHSKES